LARNLIDLHKPDQAEPYFREILALLTASAGATAPEAVAARLELALALLAQRKNAEAEPLLIEGFEAARSIENADAAERARKMLQNAADLYEAQGDAAAAEQW